jgi:hypothetical protein
MYRLTGTTIVKKKLKPLDDYAARENNGNALNNKQTTMEQMTKWRRRTRE